MLTSSQARNMAEAQWGRGGTTAYRTNRKGAFYFSCSGHGGFVIDGRAIREDAKPLLRRHAEPVITTEYWTPATGKIHKLLNPFRTRTLSFRVPMSARERDVEIWTFEEDCAWCLPAIFDGIAVTKHKPTYALDSFERWFSPSNHQLVEARALFEAHFPDHKAAA